MASNRKQQYAKPEKLLKALQVAHASIDQGEKLINDGGGLYLRVRPDGKAWLFISMIDGKRYKHGLGSYPGVTLDQARRLAQEARQHASKGVDPSTAKRAQAAERRTQAAALIDRQTVCELFQQWHAREASQRKDGGAEILRAFTKDVLAAIGALPADDIKRRQVVAILDAVRERGAGRLANQLLQYLRAMFRYAVMREIVTADPTYGLKKDSEAERESDRVLSDAEIRELSGKLYGAGLTPQAQAAIWIMLGTCARVGEVASARWQDIDEQAGTWTIPADIAKNGRAHTIHLSAFALRQFQTLNEIATSGEWVFPSRDGKTHVCTKTFQKQYRDRMRSTRLHGRSKSTGHLLLAGGEWHAHDLRRTGATLMGELGIRSDVIDRCLNHVNDNKVTRTYQRQELIAERCDAFGRLGERLELLLRNDSTVIAGRFCRAA